MKYIVFSGSFRWHFGHSKVANDIFQRFGIKPIIELNARASECTNKKAIDGEEIHRRFSLIPDFKKIVTVCPLFIDKATYLRQLFDIPIGEIVYFAVGSDTIERVDSWAEEKCHYYNRVNAEYLITGNINFIAYPRHINEEIKIKNEILNSRTIIINNFTPIDISSTEIRKQYEEKLSRISEGS